MCVYVQYGMRTYMLEVAQIAEDGSSGRSDNSQRKTETEALHAQFACDA